MKTKWIIMLMFGVFVLSMTPQKAKACEIEITVVKGKKEVYQVGDTLVLQVFVKLTHRSCPVKMKETKFNMKGLKVIKSTPWKQLSAMEYKRKLMVVVKATKGGKLNLAAIRECDKDGGFGSIKLDVTQ